MELQALKSPQAGDRDAGVCLVPPAGVWTVWERAAYPDHTGGRQGLMVVRGQQLDQSLWSR